MNKAIGCFLIPLFLLASASFASADDFKSITISGGTVSPQALPRVHGDQFMLIRNFTQEGTGSFRGVVMVSKPPGTIPSVSVLAAAVVDPNNTTQGTLEVINSVVIAGPADVSVTCGSTTGSCFISYKKEGN